MDEAQAVLAGVDAYDVMAINRAFLKWPGPVDYLVTYHGELVPEWLKARAAIDGCRPVVVTECGRFDVKYDPQTLPGGSAGLGLHYAHHVGYTKFLIAGVNLDGKYASFFDGFVGPMLSMYRSGKEFKTVNERLLGAMQKVDQGVTDVFQG